jgi:hypothetical protein
LKSLACNPSLKNPDTLQAALDRAYQYAVRSAEKETGLARAVFPKSCPYRLEQIVDMAFYPDEQNS